MIERYDTTILQTKTCTRIIQVMRDLLKLIPVTKKDRSSAVREAEGIIEQHMKKLEKVPHVHGTTYEQQIQETLDYQPK